jgi:hypothetical protein
VKVTEKNFKGLLQLCEKFRFRDLAAQLSQFRASEDFKTYLNAVLVSRLLYRRRCANSSRLIPGRVLLH